MMLLNAALDMSANLENSEVARGQEKNFHSNPKEGQWQRMLIFLLAVVIPACYSSSPAFHIVLCI